MANLSHRQGLYYAKAMQTWNKTPLLKELTSGLKRNSYIVDPPPHWDDVMKNFAKQRSHYFKYYLTLKSLHVTVLLGENYGAELIIAK